MIIPCDQCLIIPICRHKTFEELTCCERLAEVLFGYKVDSNHYLRTITDDYHDILIQVSTIIKPTMWEIINREWNDNESNRIIRHHSFKVHEEK